ncbi:MAG: bifunctional serine/threonine-protein kinase/formylglycine-generating enzyme family protein [Planctomycetota bacterium]
MATLETVLLQRVEEQLGMPSGSLSETEAAKSAFESVLAEDLTSKDSLVLQQCEGTAEDRLDRLMEERLQRALDRLLKAVLPDGIAPPIRVHLQRLKSGDHEPGGHEFDSPSHRVMIAIGDEAGSERQRSASTFFEPFDEEEPERTDGTFFEPFEEEAVDRSEVSRPAPTESGSRASTVPLDADLGAMERRLSILVEREQRDSAGLWEGTSRSGLEVGDLLGGKYRILRLLGSGGFGAVFEARDESLGSRVAIKYLNARSASADRASLREEARRVTRLNHPNIVDWKAFDEREDGSYYFVMELLEGEPLDQVLTREGRFEPARASRLMLQVLGALRAAHHIGPRQSILHLDLKPQNVILVPGRTAEDEKVKVIDFGIGQYFGTSHDDADGPLPSDATGELDLRADEGDSLLFSGGRASISAGSIERTGPGGIRLCNSCTPQYASPEQCTHLRPMGDVPVPLDGRSDVYSFGVMFFELLAGELPYQSPKNPIDWLRVHREDAPKSFGECGVRVPRPLIQFIDKCIAKDRDQRWADSAEAYAALSDIVHPPVWKAIAKVTVPLLIIVLALVWFFWPDAELPRLDLFSRAEAAGAEEQVVDRLFVGPTRSSVPLHLRGYEAPSGSVPRLVEETRAEAPALSGWTVSWTGADSLRLDVPPIEDRLQKTVYLEVAQPDGTRRYSEGFVLTGLGPGAWSIDSVAVEEMDGRALDPRNQSLRVVLRGRAEDLSGVRVTCDGRGCEGALTSSDAEHTTYSVPLGELRLSPGTRALEIIATDATGREATLTQTLEVHTTPLAIERLALNGPSQGGIYLLYEMSRPRLELSLNRRADVSWTVMDGGVELAGGLVPSFAGGPLEIDADLVSLKGGQAYQAVLQVTATEAPYVLHADAGRGRATARLEYRLSLQAPSLTAGLVLDDGAWAPLTAEVPTFTAQRRCRFRLSRDNDVPVLAELSLFTRDPEQPLRVFPPVTLTGPRIADDEVLDVELPHDGSFELRATVFQYDAETRERSDEAVFSRALPIVVDTTPPRLELEGLGTDTLLTANVPGALLTVSAAESPKTDPADRISLDWSLSPDVPGFALEELPESIRSGESMEVPVSIAELGAELEIDGPYRLMVEGRDRSGNTSEAVAATWTVARSGPVLALERPEVGLGDWLSVGGAWLVRLRATDLNGVQSATCRVTRGSSEWLEVELKSRDRSEGTTIWEGSVVFPPEWSESEVVVQVQAMDTHGNSSRELEQRFTLPVIVTHVPEIIRGRADRGRMRLVRGNESVHFTFGGRNDDVENDLFARSGLGVYNAGSLMRSWHIEYPAGSIADFYLDEHEVTGAELTRFLREGYADASHWPAGASPPGAERLRELEARFAAAPDLPATGVDWEEASAYASWAGKRLPTFVEWEYAVRAGAEYRPYAAYRSSAERPEINVAAGASGGSAWPSGRGGDVSAAGIRNLSGNVSEWTASPCYFQSGIVSSGVAEESPVIHARKHRLELLDSSRFEGASTCRDYWVVGGSYRTQSFDFSKATRGKRTMRRDDVGFRCAVSAERVLRGLESESPSSRQFEAAGEE